MKKVAWFIIIFAIAIRIYIFSFDKSLWLDEAALALNILDRNFLELFTPLIYAQSAPPLFLILVKLSTLFFGNFEYVLRFIPFMMSLGSVIAFYYLLEYLFKNNNKVIMAVTLFLFSINFPLLYYTAELKQYSSDVLFVILAFLFYFKYFKDLTPKKEIVFGFLSIIFPLFSFGSIFAFCSLAILSFAKKLKKDKGSCGSFIFPMIFTLGLIIEYFLFFKNLNPTMNIYKYWVPYFINFDILKGVKIFIYIFQYYFYSFYTALCAIVLFVLGSIYLFKNKRDIFYSFMLMIFGAFLASFLNIYPLYERLSLFLYPVFLIIIACCAYFLLEDDKLKPFWIKIIVSCLIGIFVLNMCLVNFLKPEYYLKEDIKPLVEKLLCEVKHNNKDKILVFKHSHLSWEYYTKYRGYDFSNNETLVCPSTQNDDCFSRLEKFCDKKDNCWIIYTIEIDAEHNILKLNNYMEKHNGCIVLRSGKTALLYRKRKE